MRRFAALVVASTAMLACGGITPGGATTPTASAGAHASASSTAAAPGTLGGTYGLLIVGSALNLIKPDGSVGATAPITLQGLDCSSQHDAVNLEPPVSATSD